MPASDHSDLESAAADIQLFGSLEQVAIVQKFAEDFASGGAASVDDLLKALRLDLRHELCLPALPEKMRFLRIMKSEDRLTSR